MRNSIVFVSLAMMLALTMCLTGCVLSQGETRVLSEGPTAGVVAALSNNSSNTGNQSQTDDRYQALLDRACAIYKEKTGVAIDSQQLKNALEQAQSELREEALERRLQNLVDEGKITQEQAEQYLKWWQSRPDIELPLPGKMNDEALESWLQYLVDKGKITQDTADQYLEWWQSRPDIEVPLPGLGGPGRGGGMMQPRGFGPWGGPCLSPHAPAGAGA